jgi:predicted dehydrogenase
VRYRGEVVQYDCPGRTRRFSRKKEHLHRPTVHEQFAAAILAGNAAPTPGEVGLHDLAVCLAMEESGRTGRAVDLGKFIGRMP